MNSQDIQVKIHKLKNDLPEYFSNPGQKENEICVNNEDEGRAKELVIVYHTRGCSSARVGNEKSKYTSASKTYYPIFMSAEDYFTVLPNSNF